MIWGPLWSDAHFVMRWRNEEPVGILEATFFDSINKDHEGVSEGLARFGGRANEIGNSYPAGLNDAIAQPAHPPRMFDAILMGEAEFAINIGAHLVGVE